MIQKVISKYTVRNIQIMAISSPRNFFALKKFQDVQQSFDQKLQEIQENCDQGTHFEISYRHRMNISANN